MLQIAIRRGPETMFAEQKAKGKRKTQSLFGLSDRAILT